MNLTNRACHFCKSTLVLNGNVCQDLPGIAVGICENCALTQLVDFSHIHDSYYLIDGSLPENIESERKRTKHWNRKRLHQISLNISDLTNKTVLDYGCGTGGFLEMAQGSFGRVMGFDLNQNICKAHLKNNWECYNSIEEIKTEQIDIIVMFHVLEHSKKPWDLIKQISQHFVYTNYFVIEVPNTDEALNSLFHSEDYRKNHYSSQHLWYYTPDTIKSVVQRAGLTIRYETQIQRYLLSNIFG